MFGLSSGRKGLPDQQCFAGQSNYCLLGMRLIGRARYVRCGRSGLGQCDLFLNFPLFLGVDKTLISAQTET
jgi:hypothetical protein